MSMYRTFRNKYKDWSLNQLASEYEVEFNRMAAEGDHEDMGPFMEAMADQMIIAVARLVESGELKDDVYTDAQLQVLVGVGKGLQEGIRLQQKRSLNAGESPRGVYVLDQEIVDMIEVLTNKWLTATDPTRENSRRRRRTE